MRIYLWALVFASVLASNAQAQDMPPRRAGLWEIRMTDETGKTPPQVMQQCIDAATDRMMQNFGSSLGAEMCSKQEVKKVGATLVINAECQVGPMKSRSQSVVSGDFNSSYTVRVTTKVDGLPPAAAAMAGGTRIIQATWTGACKPNQRPGDMVMPDGRTMNILELKKMMGGAGGFRPPAMPQR
jgi:hypothetical protein